MEPEARQRRDRKVTTLPSRRAVSVKLNQSPTHTANDTKRRMPSWILGSVPCVQPPRTISCCRDVCRVRRPVRPSRARHTGQTTATHTKESRGNPRIVLTPMWVRLLDPLGISSEPFRRHFRYMKVRFRKCSFSQQILMIL